MSDRYHELFPYLELCLNLSHPAGILTAMDNFAALSIVSTNHGWPTSARHLNMAHRRSGLIQRRNRFDVVFGLAGIVKFVLSTRVWHLVMGYFQRPLA